MTGAVALLVLTGCASPVNSAGDAPPSGAAPTEEVPEFSGPWAEELAAAWRESDNPRFRAIIADGEVTSAEYAETQNAAKKCLEENGFTGIEYNPDGGSTIAARTDISPEKEDELTRMCEDEAGFIDTEVWYFDLWLNPDNLNWPAAERDCLVKVGHLEKGSSIEDMEAWWRSGVPDTKSVEAHQCATDPFQRRGTPRK